MNSKKLRIFIKFSSSNEPKIDSYFFHQTTLHIPCACFSRTGNSAVRGQFLVMVKQAHAIFRKFFYGSPSVSKSKRIIHIYPSLVHQLWVYTTRKQNLQNNVIKMTMGSTTVKSIEEVYSAKVWKIMFLCLICRNILGLLNHVNVSLNWLFILMALIKSCICKHSNIPFYFTSL